jgi:hypothetical protein
MSDGPHQIAVAILIVIGCIKAIFGYYAVHLAWQRGEVAPMLRDPRRASFAFLLGLTKITSDAVLYLILAWSVRTGTDPLPVWGIPYLTYSLCVQLATFVAWAEETTDGPGA